MEWVVAIWNTLWDNQILIAVVLAFLVSAGIRIFALFRKRGKKKEERPS